MPISYNIQKQDLSGRAYTPGQPMFSVHKSDGNVSGSIPGTQLVFNAVQVNQSNSYSNSTGRFTAPVAGTYYFSFSGMLNSTNSASDLQIIMDKNGSSYSISNPPTAGTAQGMGFACSAVITLSAGDYVTIRFYASNSGGAVFYAAGGPFNNFSGFLIG